MPIAKLTRSEALDRITQVFRRWGFDGASLRLISDATGLGRASLYHHFPGGKDEMGEAVFAHIGEVVEREVIAPLRSPGTPLERLQRHARGVSKLYDGGESNCIFGAMMLGGGGERFAGHIQDALRHWLKSVSAVVRDSGVPAAEARRRSEAAMVRIQGALIVSRGLGSTAAFRKVTQELASALLDGD